MAGGLVSNSSIWKLGAKTYVAPTPREQQLEARSRAIHIAEERKIKDVKQATRRLAETRELERKVARALGAELGSRRFAGGYGGGFGGGLGGGRGGRGLYRSRSVGNLGLERERQRLAMESEAIRAREMQQMETERIRMQRHAMEEQAINRQRTRSMINNERANLAALNAASIAHRPVIVAPGYSAGMGGRLPGGSMGLGGGMPRPQLGERMRSRSLSGVIPGAGYGGSPFLGGASPRTMPMGSPSQRPVVHNTYNVQPVQPVPISMHGNSPRLSTFGYSPREQHLGLSPHLHANGFRSSHNSPRMGNLGQFDDLKGVGGFAMRHQSPAIDPLVLGGGMMDNGPPFGGGMMPFPQPTPYGSAHSHRSQYLGGNSPRVSARGSPYNSPRMRPQRDELEFTVTDQSQPENGRIIQSLGTLEGYSSAGGAAGFEDEDQLMELAMQNLIANARSLGANGIVSLDVGADGQGGVVARGHAVVLD